MLSSLRSVPYQKLKMKLLHCPNVGNDVERCPALRSVPYQKSK